MLLTDHVEQTQVGRNITNVIHMRPIAYQGGGILRPIATDWADSGIGERPHMVANAKLQVSTGNDGTRRIHPTREADRWIELGSPYVKVGGTWKQVSLGTPSRAGHTLTWTRAQTITSVTHAGHYIKLAIEMRNGWVPEDNLIAFPVGIQGLTRNGSQILREGVPVLSLRKMHIYDAVNELDTLPIAHQFTNLGGNPYLLLTLPDTSGMTRPVIDPTLPLQPDGTDGLDTYMITNSADGNKGAEVLLWTGEHNSGANLRGRGLIKFDLSTLPDAAVISAATFSLYAEQDLSDNARTCRVFRSLRAWLELEATWNSWTTGNSWSTAGGFHADDCEQSDIGSFNYTATETLNEFKDSTLTPTTKAGLDLGNGWLIKFDTQIDDMYVSASSDSATAANRPKLSITYTLGGHTLTTLGAG